jgi:hypothetical protein
MLVIYCKFSFFQNIVINATSASNTGKNSLDTLYVKFFFVHDTGSFEKVYNFSIFLWFMNAFLYKDFSTFPTFLETTMKI